MKRAAHTIVDVIFRISLMAIIPLVFLHWYMAAKLHDIHLHQQELQSTLKEATEVLVETQKNTKE